MAELKVSLYIIKDKKTYSIESVHPDDIKIMSGRLGKVMSNYYTQHPHELLRIGCEFNK